MSGEYLSIRVKKDTIEAIRQLNNVRCGCISQAIDLGFLVDRERIYQQVGTDFIKVAIRDIDPLPKPNILDRFAEPLNIQMDSDLYSNINNKVGTFTEWVSRAIALRLRAEKLHLYFFNGVEYKNINFYIQLQEDS